MKRHGVRTLLLVCILGVLLTALALQAGQENWSVLGVYQAADARSALGRAQADCTARDAECADVLAIWQSAVEICAELNCETIEIRGDIRFPFLQTVRQVELALSHGITTTHTTPVALQAKPLPRRTLRRAMEFGAGGR